MRVVHERDPHTRKLWWRAEVQVGSDEYVGTGETEVEALVNLVELMERECI